MLELHYQMIQFLIIFTISIIVISIITVIVFGLLFEAAMYE